MGRRGFLLGDANSYVLACSIMSLSEFEVDDESGCPRSASARTLSYGDSHVRFAHESSHFGSMVARRVLRQLENCIFHSILFRIMHELTVAPLAGRVG